MWVAHSVLGSSAGAQLAVWLPRSHVPGSSGSDPPGVVRSSQPLWAALASVGEGAAGAQGSPYGLKTNLFLNW